MQRTLSERAAVAAAAVARSAQANANRSAAALDRRASTPPPTGAAATLLVEAQNQFARGDYRGAIATAQRAAADPTCPQAILLAANAQANLAEHAAALKSCQQLLERDPLNAEAYYLLAHRFEDALNVARQAGNTPAPELFAHLASHLEASRKLVAEAVNGVPAGIDISAVLVALDALRSGTPPAGDGSPPAHKPERVPPPADIPRVPPVTAATDAAVSVAQARALQPSRETPAAPVGPDPLPAPSAAGNGGSAPPTQVSGFKIATVRVAPERLDALMTHAGELSATKLRIERRLMQIEELFSFWEEWSRETGSAGSRKSHRNGHGGLDGDALQRHTDRVQQLGELLTHLKAVAEEDTARLDYVSGELEHGIHSLRLLPLSTVFNRFLVGESPYFVNEHRLQRQDGSFVWVLARGASVRNASGTAYRIAGSLTDMSQRKKREATPLPLGGERELRPKAACPPRW